MASDALLDNAVSHKWHGAQGFEEVERVVVFRKEMSIKQIDSIDLLVR